MKEKVVLKKSRRIFSILLVIAFVIVLIWFVVSNSSQEQAYLPWEKEGHKPPSEYTWEEFEKLEGIQKDLFFESFGSAEAFEMWMSAAGFPVQQTIPFERLPWDQDGKQPCDYTWEEYQHLTESQKDCFYESFNSADNFAAWMDAAKPKQETAMNKLPWEVTGVAPNAYTWEEYLALQSDEQDLFFESFESPEAFDVWMDRVNPIISAEETEEQSLWDSEEKQPYQYTWEEFLELSPELQEEFFLSFSVPEQFEVWMNRVKRN